MKLISPVTLRAICDYMSTIYQLNTDDVPNFDQLRAPIKEIVKALGFKVSLLIHFIFCIKNYLLMENKRSNKQIIFCFFVQANACLRLSNSKSKATNTSNNINKNMVNTSTSARATKVNENFDKNIHMNGIKWTEKQLDVEQNDLEDGEDLEDDEDDNDDEEEDEYEQEVCISFQKQ